MMDNKKTKLSKTVLQMKFMKRTLEKVEREEDEAEGRAMYSKEITEKMLHGHSHIIIEPSFVICEGLHACGRFSYRGMNKEIEKIQNAEEEAKLSKEQLEERMRNKEMKKDVDDIEMLKYYSSLVDTMGSKFSSNKKRKADSNHGPPGAHTWKARKH